MRDNSFFHKARKAPVSDAKPARYTVPMKWQERLAQSKESPFSVSKWDGECGHPLPGPWTLVGSVALGVVAWAVWGIVKMLKP